MKKVLSWILGIVLGLIVLFGLGAIFLWGRWMPMASRGFLDRRGMMPWGFETMHPFGGGLMFLSWLIPAGLLVLVVIGVVLLVNALTRPKKTVAPTAVALPAEQKCAQCGKTLQADWTVCAYCGTPVTAPAPAQRICASCGKPAEADWTTCPYCGTSLA